MAGLQGLSATSPYHSRFAYPPDPTNIPRIEALLLESRNGHDITIAFRLENPRILGWFDALAGFKIILRRRKDVR